MSEIQQLQSNKDRIVAVDIVRLLAAFMVMYEHLEMPGITDDISLFFRFRDSFVLRVSPIFFFLSGYFACRNISWKKAFNNAWWCFAPFVLWNTLCIFLNYCFSPTLLEGQSLVSLFGFSSVINGPESGSYPADVPLWFMRDLIFLFLLSPLLVKISKYVVIAVVVLSIVPSTMWHTNSLGKVFLSLGTVCFFSCGCYLQTLSKETQRRALKFYSPSFLVIYTICVLAVCILTYVYPVLNVVSKRSFLYSALNLVFLYQLARWLEVKFPKLKGIALKYAPVTFLTFAGHCILNRLFFALVKHVHMPADFLLVVPCIDFAIFALMFFALKRWFRPLLHLVAHYKLRAEDVRKDVA